MPANITHLYRYPVKGLSAEALPTLALRAGLGLAGDRAYALTNGSWQFDAANVQPRPKTDFLMLARYERLAKLQSSFDEATHTLTLSHAGDVLLSASLRTAEGREYIEEFFSIYMRSEVEGSPQVVYAEGHQFTDVSVLSPVMMRSVSLINVASVKSLENTIQKRVDLMRFRANIHIDGVQAWEELSWVDREVHIGSVRARVVARTPRCSATNVNPSTAARDMEIPRSIRTHFGHSDLGVYLEILSDGTISLGDAVHVQAAVDPAREL